MTRRSVLKAGMGLAALGAGGLLLRPRAQGAPHDAYFARLQAALQGVDKAVPVLLLDKTRLMQNAAWIAQDVARRVRESGGQLGLRLAAKSLPSVPLLQALMAQLRTDKLMVFNLPQLLQLTQALPRSDVLLGKPLPVDAAQAFYARTAKQGFEPAAQLQWLVDTPARLLEYQALARTLQQRLRISIEIDVGLHRGGVQHAQQLQAMLAVLETEPLLQFAGMMGYDAHVAKIPDVFASRDEAAQASAHVYAGYKAQALAALPRLATPVHAEALVWNTGGSLTYQLHDGKRAANEVSIGSAFVLPSDFDSPHLIAGLRPAAFIATPVLKTGAFAMPYGAQALGTAARWWDTNTRQAVFVYGGYWLADSVSPTGLRTSSLYGRSSNQEMLVGSGLQQLAVGDTVFLRPRQSEAVLNQFEDLRVYDEGALATRWPVLAPSP